MRKVFFISALIVILLLIGLNVFLIKNNKYSLQQEQSAESVPQVEASEITSMDSPDGKLTLVMRKEKSENGYTYTFSVSGYEIFVKTVDLATTISIPKNTWSPDGKYIFLEEISGADKSFFALSSTISSANQSDQTSNITDKFTAKYTDLKIGDVTGWGGMNLIVINSVKADGTRGPSFWYEMPSGLFIQLSTLF